MSIDIHAHFAPAPAFAGMRAVIMLGMDYPFDMGLDRPLEFVDRLGLPDHRRRAVLSENANRFLRPL